MANALVTVADEVVRVNVMGADVVAAMVEEAEGYRDEAEAASAILGGASDAGDVPTGTGVAGSPTWVSRLALGEQPTSAVDTSVTTGVQHLNQLPSPSTRATLASDGTVLTVTAGASISTLIPSVVAGTTHEWAIGKTFVVRGAITTLPSSNTGIVMAWLTSAPTPGGAVAVTPAGSCLLVMRGNGTIGLRTEDGTTSFPGGSIDLPGGGGSPGSVGTFTTEAVELRVTMMTATSAIVVPVIDGAAQLTRIITGLPSGTYFGGGLRIAGATCAGEISRLEARGLSLDVPLRLYVDPDATPGDGDGSRDNPFATLEEAQFVLDTDATRRSFVLTLAGGTHLGTLRVNGSRWDEATIRGVAGERPIIKASVPIETAWTQIGVSEVWYTDKPVYKDSNTSYGSLMDVTPGTSHSYGRTSSYTVEGCGLYARQPANTTYDNPYFARGTMSVHNTGAYSGMVLVRMHDGGDPNASDWEYTSYDYCLSVIADETDGWNACNVTVEGVDLEGAFSTGLHLRRVRYRLHDIVSTKHSGFGFEFDQARGDGSALYATLTVFDGFHANGLAPAALRVLRSTFHNCHATAQGYFPTISDGVGGSTISVGDGWSNHESDEHGWDLWGCSSIAAGKDGIASSGAAYLNDFTADDAWGAGVTLYGQADIDEADLTVVGGVIRRCFYGLNCNTGALGSITRTVDARGVTFKDNAQNHVLAYGTVGTATAHIDMTDCRYLGSTPAGGNTDQSSAAGTITIDTSTAAVA